MSINTNLILAESVLDTLAKLQDMDLRLLFGNDGSLQTEQSSWYRTLSKIGNYVLPYYIIYKRNVQNLNPLIVKTIFTIEKEKFFFDSDKLWKITIKVQNALKGLRNFYFSYEKYPANQFIIENAYNKLNELNIKLIEQSFDE